LQVKEHAKHIAAQGYRCLIPDLYRGKLGLEAEEAHHLMSNLDFQGALEDVRGAAQHLKAEGSAKVGATGFCMGGALALGAAIRVPEIDCAAPFYGANFKLADPENCSKPIQGHFGAHDQAKNFSDPATADALEAKLQKAGCPHEVFRYEKVGHAFMNATPAGIARRSKLGQGEHDQPSVDLAWTRVFAFFDKYLKN
jgi:carboxymethylenebutenolidase